jgi:phosphopantothenoylcysteine decarboxylase/phosphopantothenate--cysteine ligase
MWANPATQANVATLRARGIRLLGPASGGQACGEFGAGRLLEAGELVAELAAQRVPRELAGVRVLVSAGPTFEDIDPVRYIGNRSSGRMGFAVAEAAAQAGADVVLVAGPVALETPARVRRVDVRSAREMHAAVLGEAARSDVYVGAAAVGDFRARETAQGKLKKSGPDATLELSLVQNPDILAEVAALRPRPFVVGFAAETADLERHARDKLERKDLDLVAANGVGEGRGFEREDNELLLLWHGGDEALSRAHKRVLARRLVARIAALRVLARGTLA